MAATRHNQRVRRALIGVALMLVGLCAEGLHEIFSPHRVCAVHGALEHGHHGESADHSLEAAPDHDPADAPRLAEDRDGSSHEACWLVAFGRKRVDLALPPATIVVPLLAQAVQPHLRPHFLPRPPTIPTLRFAPKQSPPAA